MDGNNYAEKIDFAKAIMQHSSHLISLADTKAGMLLGINGIILALLLGLERQGISPLSIVFLVGTGIALSFSSVFAILTIIPRLSIGTEWASFISNL